ncbi:ABC-type multidrug transport system fused ATPase/permease subunit [Desulfitispora alkaliphila]|uniref:M50 family metallopeptidase n=1 Tax=Desulfitispora alkaliphila TaxID=622674 RepID=UPI003D1DA1E4
MKKERKNYTFFYFIIALIVISFVLSDGFSNLVTSAVLKIEAVEYTPLSPQIYMMSILFSFFFAIAMHELGHFISFIRNGIRMRAVFVSMFLFIKQKGRWTLKIKPNKFTNFGGIAVPELNFIEDEEDFKRVQDAYARAIVAGPLASIFTWVSAVLFTVLAILLGVGNYVASILFTITIALTIITLLLIFNSFSKNGAVIGDFPASILYKHNRFFAAIQLYQYGVLSSDYDRVRRENKFLRELICDELEEKFKEKDTTPLTLKILDNFIVEYLSGVSNAMPQVVWDYIEFLLDNPDRMNETRKSEVTLLLQFHMVRLLYTNENTEKKAVELYKDLKSVVGNSSIEEYLIKQTEHLLGLAQYDEYLKNEENIKISAAQDVWKHFEGFLADEIRLNKKII